MTKGAPLGLKLAPGYFEQWRAKANKLFVNNSNGRKGRATKAVFNDATGTRDLRVDERHGEGRARGDQPRHGASQFDNLLGIGNGNHAMTIDTSASLGTITQVLATGQYPNVDARRRHRCPARQARAACSSRAARSTS